MFDLSNHVAVITGAGSGIGEGTALAFAHCGAKVVAIDINGDAVAQTVDEITRRSGQAAAIQADVGSEASIDNAFKQVEQQAPRIDSLLNVAGIELYKDYLDVTDAEWDRQIAVNLKSVFLCARRAIPIMKRHGGGSIINTSSVQALATTGRITAYAAAKGGIISMSRDLARDFAKDGIRINTICPGCINTPMMDRAFDSPEARDRAVAELNEGIPLGRLGEPRDFAHLAMFLASSLSSYITGQAIVLDGGLMCRLPLT